MCPPAQATTFTPCQSLSTVSSWPVWYMYTLAPAACNLQSIKYNQQLLLRQGNEESEKRERDLVCPAAGWVALLCEGGRRDFSVSLRTAASRDPYKEAINSSTHTC